MALVTNTTFGPEFSNALLRTSIHRKLLPRLKNRLRVAEFCMDGVIAANANSKELRINTMLDIDVSTSGLSETDAGTDITTITLTGTSTPVIEFGRWAKVSSLTNMVWTETERSEVADVFAFNASKVIDTICRDQAYRTTNHFTARNTSMNSVTGYSSLSGGMAHDIAYLESHFNENDCEGFESLNGSYAMLIHGRTERQIKTDITTGKLSWSNIFQNTDSGQKRITQGYIGTILNTSAIRTNNLTSSVTISTNNPAYSNLVLAKGAVAKVGLGGSGDNFDIVIKKSGPNDTGNPLNMYSTIGWKATFAAMLLHSTRAIRYYTGTGV